MGAGLAVAGGDGGEFACPFGGEALQAVVPAAAVVLELAALVAGQLVGGEECELFALATALLLELGAQGGLEAVEGRGDTAFLLRAAVGEPALQLTAEFAGAGLQGPVEGVAEPGPGLPRRSLPGKQDGTYTL